MTQRGEFQIIEQLPRTRPSARGRARVRGRLRADRHRRPPHRGDLRHGGAGTHFLPDADPEDVGYKALAVNLSDLAAAGRFPRSFFPSAPRRDDGWLKQTSPADDGPGAEHGCALPEATRRGLLKSPTGGIPRRHQHHGDGGPPRREGPHPRGREAGRRRLGLRHGGDAYAALRLPPGALGRDARRPPAALRPHGPPGAEVGPRPGAP